MANNVQVGVLRNVNTKLTEKLEEEAKALPSNFNTLRFKQNAMTVLQGLDLSKMVGKEYELARCIIKGAYLNLDFANRECYVITYGGNPEFMTDYKGEEKLVYNYAVRPVKNINSQIIKDGEEFWIETNGEEKKIIHRQGISDNRIIGAYSVVIYQDGTTNFEVMTRKEIETVRDKFSKQPKGKAWSDSFGEMCKKTVLRRLCKHIQLNFDNIEQINAWNTASDANFATDMSSPYYGKSLDEIRDMRLQEVREKKEQFEKSKTQEDDIPFSDFQDAEIVKEGE
ncbi:RecT family recombinase [Clostridium sp.]|uniref:RecT family recombinase n=1 Tax=Clostridium sp. TaxID=1506 RepID=UPI00321707C9